MSHPAWYDAWRDDALHELVAKQNRLYDAFKIGDWPRFDCDFEAGVLDFSDAEGDAPKVRAEIQIVGSTSTSTNDWLWSWGNPHLVETSCEDLLRVRQFGVDNGIDELTTDYLRNDNLEGFAWMLTAVAARILNAPGAYRPPRDEGGGIFLIYRSVNFVS